MIELLRVANRPLTLCLRRVGRERLLRRRAEMRALTRPQGVVGNSTRAGPAGAIAPPQTAAAAVGGGALVNSQARGTPPTALPPPPPPPPSGPPPPPRRRLQRQDSFPAEDSRRDAGSHSDIAGGGGTGARAGGNDSGDGSGARSGGAVVGEGRPLDGNVSPGGRSVGSSVDGGGDGSSVPVGTATAGAAVAAVMERAGAVGGGGVVGAGGGGTGGSAREQGAAAAAAAGLAGNWEAVKWAESSLLTVRVFVVVSWMCVWLVVVGYRLRS